MTVIRAQTEFFWTDSLPRDSVSNTLYFRVATGIAYGGPDYDQLATDLQAVWRAFAPYSTRGIRVKLYNMADAKPRAIKGEKRVVGSQSYQSTGNRDTALCLSFYSDRNLPRRRGRVYLGPFSASDVGTLKPPGALMSAIAALPAAFAGLGGVNVDWVVYSPTTDLGSPTEDSAFKVSNWYIDDEWDTQRRRGLRSASRTSGTTSG